jgi:hypothetical protein
MSILKDCLSQIIDDNGKTRALNFSIKGENLTLMTSPIAPLQNKKQTTDIYECSLATAKIFLNIYSINLKYQSKYDDIHIDGIWVEVQEESIFYSYIPLNIKTLALKDVEINNENPPLTVSNTRKSSRLNNYSINKLVSDILKQVSIYIASKSENKTFNESSFKVVPNIGYSLESLKENSINNKNYDFENDKIFIKNNKILVPTEEIRDRLINYITALKISKPFLFEENIYNSNHIFQKSYDNYKDFKSSSDTLLFLNKKSLSEYIAQKKEQEQSSTVFSYFKRDSILPYYLKSPYIENNKMAIIQNVRDELLIRALNVSITWYIDKINTGYNTEELTDGEIAKQFNIIIYNKDGVYKKNKIHDPKKGDIHLIIYDKDKYAAYLPIENNKT